MSKKKNKKKKKKELTYSMVMDVDIKKRHDMAIDEIMKMEKKIKKKDKKIKKKAKKMQYNGILSKYSPTAEMQQIRLDAVNHMKKIDLLGIVENILKGVLPIVTTIARLIASLITLIFQCKYIREKIPMKYLAKMEHVYQIAMAI
jgi:hypothetical protein